MNALTERERETEAKRKILFNITERHAGRDRVDETDGFRERERERDNGYGYE